MFPSTTFNPFVNSATASTDQSDRDSAGHAATTVSFANNQYSVTRHDGTTATYTNKAITDLFSALDSRLSPDAKEDKDALSKIFRSPIVAQLGHHFNNLTPGQITFVEKYGITVINESSDEVRIKPGEADVNKASIPGFFVIVRDNGNLEITDAVPEGKAHVNQMDYSKESNSKKFTKTKEMFLLNNKIINSSAHLLITDQSTGKQYALLLKTGDSSYKSAGGSAEAQDIHRDGEGKVMVAKSLLQAAIRELSEEAFGLPKDSTTKPDAYLKEMGLVTRSAPLVQIQDRGNGDYVRAGRPEFNINTCLSPAVVLDCEVASIETLQTKLRVEAGHEDETPVLIEVSDLVAKSKEKDSEGKNLYDFRGANFVIKDAAKNLLAGERVSA